MPITFLEGIANSTGQSKKQKMISTNIIQIQSVLKELIKDSESDYFRIIKGLSKSILGKPSPADFKNAYLAISQEQGIELVQLIEENAYKNIVEFGTSFGISTLYLAQGVAATGGQIVTTELIPSKAERAISNFKKAGVDHLIETKVGDAMLTLKDHGTPIDLLLLDGWKDLYAPLFNMLEPLFHEKTLIYVDNANMKETADFLALVKANTAYSVSYHHKGKVAFIERT